MTKRKKLIAVIAVFVCGGLVLAGMYVASNLSEQPSLVVEQQVQSSNVTQTSESKLVAKGTFTDTDAVHKGSGTASIYQTPSGAVLQFDNFSTTAGPDLFVYLSPNQAKQDLGAFASLGRLQKTSGNQTYTLPDNYKDYKSVVVWCRAFSVTFTTADLSYL